MLKKKMISLIALSLALVMLFIVPVSAARYTVVDYNDYVTDVAVEGENDLVTLTIPYKDSFWEWQKSTGDETTILANGSGVSSITLPYYDIDWRNWNNKHTSLICRPLGFSLLDLSNIPDNTEISTKLHIHTYGVENFDFAYGSVSLQYYDKNLNVVSLETIDADIWDLGAFGVGRTLNFVGTISKPEGAAYLMIRITLDLQYLKDTVTGVSVNVVYDDLILNMSISSLYRLQQQTGQTNKLLGNISNQLEEQGQTLEEVVKGQADIKDSVDNLKDTIEQQPNKEKDEASQSGDKNVGAVLDVIPNESSGFMNAIKSFADSFSYQGTDAKLTIPAIVMPEIPGLIPKTALSDEMVLDFEQYFNLLPEWLLILVQSLLTIALIVYCFKELYDIIAYVMTMKRGSAE